MKRAPLRFRIPVDGSWFLRVQVYEGRTEMLQAVQACHGERHSNEYAATVYAPGAPDQGCVADLFFSWRVLRPSVIAHEAFHGAVAVAVATKRGVCADPASDEFLAGWVERITDRVWLKTQGAPL